jgi:hypothetical protein
MNHRSRELLEQLNNYRLLKHTIHHEQIIFVWYHCTSGKYVSFFAFFGDAISVVSVIIIIIILQELGLLTRSETIDMLC